MLRSWLAACILAAMAFVGGWAHASTPVPFPFPVPPSGTAFTCSCGQPWGGGGNSCNGGIPTTLMSIGQCIAAYSQTETKWINSVGCAADVPDQAFVPSWVPVAGGFDLYLAYQSFTNDMVPCSGKYTAVSIIGWMTSTTLKCPPQPPHTNPIFNSVQESILNGVPTCSCPPYNSTTPEHWVPRRGDGGPGGIEGTCMPPSYIMEMGNPGFPVGVPDPSM